MSLVILGMEMPKEGTVIAIYKLNGKFYASLHGTELCPIVPLPEKHGRLIDADEMKSIWSGATINGDIGILLDMRPTIIEAEGEDG